MKKWEIFLIALLSIWPLAVPAGAPALGQGGPEAGVGPRRLGTNAAGWRRIETPHFLFIFEERDRTAVDELLGFCEEVYDKVTGFFRSYPSKIPCIVFGRSDSYGGWTSTFPPHILLNVAAPTGVTFGDRNESWLKLVLTHELTHYVHGTMDRGLLGFFSRILGPDIAAFALDFLPGWMIEGPSTELETLFTEGGRGRSPWWELYSKAPIMEGTLFSLDRAAYASAYPPPGRIYVGGRLMVDYILRHFGDDAFTRILDAYLAFPFFGPWCAIQTVTGKPASEVYSDMEKELSDMYAGEAGIRGGRRITPDRIASFTHPQATSRGLYLMRTDLESFPSIIRFDPVTMKEETVCKVDLSDAYSFCAAADGEKIWLSSPTQEGSIPPEAEESADLYTMETGSGHVTRLTRGAHLVQPAVSGDGSRLIAVQVIGSYSRLVAVDPDTGACRVLFSREGARVTAPAVSPRGARAAFTLNIRGLQDAFVLDLDQAYARSAPQIDPSSPMTEVNADQARPVLGPDPFGEYLPAFASDDRLLFSSDRTGSLCMYEADLSSQGHGGPEAGARMDAGAPAGAVALIQRDPVGADFGIEAGGSLLYGSYTSKGICLKEVPLADLANEPVPPDERASESYLPAIPPAAPAASAPYFDFPLPLFWLPSFVQAETGPSANEIGVGFLVMGGSILGKWGWTVGAGYLFTAAQPVANLTLGGYLEGVGLLQLSMNLGYGYSPGPAEDLYTQSLSSFLSVTTPLISTSSFDRSQSLSVSAGISYTASLTASAPFNAAGSLSGAGLSDRSFATVQSGINYSAAVHGGSIDFFPPWQLALALSNTLLPPLLSAAVWGDLAGLEWSANVPSPVPHQVVKLGIKASYGLGPYGSRADSIAVPRSFTDPLSFGAAGRALASVDYLMPIALLDAPLIFGFNLTGLAAGLHVEALGAWGLDPLGLSLSSSLYVGAELMLIVGFFSISSPVCIGAAARIDTANPGSFSAATDFKLYVIMSFDSFRDAVSAPKRASGRPRA
jgi:hypothetical protein